MFSPITERQSQVAACGYALPIPLQFAHHQLRQRTYAVTTIGVVNPGDTSLLAQTFDDILTLVTCYPFTRSPHSPLRFIVRATPVASRT